MSSGGLSLFAARAFADRYAKATSEKQLAQSFWRDFFTQVCGVEDLLTAGIEFEHPVKSSASGNIRFVDVLWPGVVLIEHKSAGEDLDKAEAQARDYLVSLADVKRPPVFIVCDFVRIRIINVYADTRIEFLLADLPTHLHHVEGVVSGAVARATQAQVAADVQAANLMSQLYVEFEAAGYVDHAVSVFLVRTLFILFGDDTGMWKRDLFHDFLAGAPKDGSGLGYMMQELFQVLDTPKEQRPKSLSPTLAEFPYVNGGMFTELLPAFSFTPRMRSALVAAGNYDWSAISPALFGSMFQTVKSREARRELGEHYTSEANILKVIGPLFLNELHEKLHAVWENPAALKKLRDELGELQFLDPACGCGNFLLVAYKRLRDLELKVIARLAELQGSLALTIDSSIGQRVHLGQFHGIEYEEWSAQIARVAMFLADHQANLAAEEITGFVHDRFPLSESATIVHGNALRTDWATVCPMSEKTVIMGNPPFSGYTWLTDEQSEDSQRVWAGVPASGRLDYVANWYLLGGKALAGTLGRAAFVSTNSVTQGEQPPIIWGQLGKLGMGIDFAHRSFNWSNDAPGVASVTCVIVGYSARQKPALRQLWKYPELRGEPTLALVENINAYLLDGPNVLVTSRRKPLQAKTQLMDNGSKPVDDGFLSNIGPDEAADIAARDSIAAKYLRRILGAQELIHGIERWCLWLVDATPAEIRQSSVLSERVAAVRNFRMASKKADTVKSADRPNEFQQIRQPRTTYIAVPRITSENREYVPIARLESDVILNDKVSFIADGSLVTFGVLCSRPFNVWNKAVSGRTRNDTLISNTITYNNFPFPDLNAKQTQAVEDAAEHVLTARAEFPHDSLADLYDAVAMPAPLRRAHKNLDQVVLAAFGLPDNATDEDILRVLFENYELLAA